MHNLWANKWALTQHLKEDDPDRSVEFCELTLNMPEDVSGQNWLERLALCADMNTCGTYSVNVASYDIFCTNKINTRNRLHQSYGDL
ncbi:hypothetical protein AVEN_251948-1 [Araneus ventricosus]|uniref:Uncharacterized protein n=1 Tax=Araneus ventricosus TaxID=182803 RepID=A0A4Y2LQN4_ARAVE|nr:hypothetical protein AVEN_251948-1 [Araneus ventricosus]